MKEKALLFGKFKTLVGVLTEPDLSADGDLPAVILSNAGLIHRIGPNRIYVKLARHLAARGYRVLRFDLSGIGDSLPRPDHLPAEQFTVDDVVQAMDHLSESGSRSFVLMGHCAGAYHSFRTAAQDPRVAGVVMMNPDGGEAEWIEYDRKRKLARYYENYYGKKTLFDPQRWKRFFSGQIHYRNVLQTFFRNVIMNRVSGLLFKLKQRFSPRQSAPQDGKLFSIEAILTRLLELDVPTLLVLSANATSLERIQTGMGKTLKRLQAAQKLNLVVIPDADHIFSPLSSQADLLQQITRWLDNRFESKTAARKGV